MKIISVDLCTVSAGDIDFSPLDELGEVLYYDVLTPGGLALAARDAEALLVNKAQVDEALLEACPKLKYVGTYATGYNNVDLAACTRRGITVCNVPGYSTNAVAQHAFALLLCLCGNIDKYSASVANGDWKRSKSFSYMPWQTRELSGLTFGVYGYGNIGRAVARAAEVFGMKVIVHTRSVPQNCPYELVSADEIFERSDYLSLHCPLSPATEKIVNARTLALMIYGDLDISVLDELPPGRQTVRTDVVDSRYHKRIYAFIKKQIEAGNRAYIVCPLVEESESENMISAEKYAEELANGAFRGINIGLLHGKMKPAQKENVMQAFADGDIKLLVATTVIEVGVDVPEATVMVVENAERFGLSQLHQLRGRVGRGKEQAYCILVSDSKSDTAAERLQTMKKYSDGFKIADVDLKLRGPGDFFGNRQHGLPDLKIADMLEDMDTLKKCRACADRILAEDYALDMPKYKALANHISDMFRNSVSN